MVGPPRAPASGAYAARCTTTFATENAEDQPPAPLPPTALLFAGQGAQTVGMTAALMEQQELPAAAAAVAQMYEEAAETLQYDLKAIVLEGPTAVLDQTVHAQPALLIAGLAAVEVLRAHATRGGGGGGGGSALSRCGAVAGLSLGEYCALVHAGALSFADAVKVVHARAAAMQRAGEAAQGVSSVQ